MAPRKHAVERPRGHHRHSQCAGWVAVRPTCFGWYTVAHALYSCVVLYEPRNIIVRSKAELCTLHILV